uniref:C-type lectin domain-containing protein n=1 Tax=Acrobeloides nanus TaxID=290746 RepID=A0A914CDL3_9BILA
MCQNDGANLASIHSPEENSYIANSTYMYLQQERNVWIGIYLDNSTLTWKWTDGSFVDYTNWGFERPFPGDGCGILVNSQWPNYCNTTNFCNWFGLWDTQSSYDCTLSNSKIVYAACKMSPN